MGLGCLDWGFGFGLSYGLRLNWIWVELWVECKQLVMGFDLVLRNGSGLRTGLGLWMWTVALDLGANLDLVSFYYGHLLSAGDSFSLGIWNSFKG